MSDFDPYLRRARGRGRDISQQTREPLGAERDFRRLQEMRTSGTSAGEPERAVTENIEEEFTVDHLRQRLLTSTYSASGVNKRDDELEVSLGRGSSRKRNTDFLPIRPPVPLIIDTTTEGVPPLVVPVAQRMATDHSLAPDDVGLGLRQPQQYLTEYNVSGQQSTIQPREVSSFAGSEYQYMTDIMKRDSNIQHRQNIPMIVDLESSESELESLLIGNINELNPDPQQPTSFITRMNLSHLSQNFSTNTQPSNIPAQDFSAQIPPTHVDHVASVGKYLSQGQGDLDESNFDSEIVMLYKRRGAETCQVLTTPVLVTRPKHMIDKRGTYGKPIALQSNHFKLCSAQDWVVYQYQVVFDPPKEPTSLRKKVMKAHRLSLGSFIFDGTLLYSSKLFNQNPMILATTRRGECVTITITLDGKLNPQDSKYMRLFNALVRKCLSSLKMQLLGINYYDPSAKTTLSVDRMNNWDLWPGFMLSVRQHEQDVLLCAEITHKVMRNETVLDLLNSLHTKSESRVKNAVKGLEVLTDYNNRTYYIMDINYDVTPQSTFIMKDGRALTYATYYKEKYHRRISNSSQPMLMSRFKSRADESIQIVYLIPELCRIVGLNEDWMKHDMYLFRALAERTNFTPRTHIQTVQDFIKRIIYETQTCEVLKEWNMELKAEMMELEGRQLPAEKIILGPGSHHRAEFDWTPELYGATFISPVVLNWWKVLVPNEMTKDAGSFLRNVRKVAKDMGMIIEEPQVINMIDDSVASFTKELDKIFAKGEKPQLVFCFLRNRSEERYNAIKRKCSLENAVASQVMIKKSIDDYMEKPITRRLVMQMNCKIGGAPWSVEIPLRGLMVVGIEVCRDSVNKGMSYCALVASLNGTFSRFVSAAAPFHTNEERSKALADLFSKALHKFCLRNDNKLPSYIVVYRDGVGKREIPFIHENEVKNFKDVMKRVYGAQHWRLAYVLVAKHSNTRIFSRNGLNPPAGTVVDDCITRPERYDFFMITGHMFRKTEAAFPTMYNVVFDNTGLDADKMQRLTYKLTHLYYNVKGMIRTPAPVRYAQRLVQMVALHLHRAPHSELSELLYYL